MDYEEQDSEVVRLLSRLRETESPYPADLMAARRQRFVKEIAALGLGTAAAVAVKGAAKAAGGASTLPLASTVVETALIVAIVAEAGFVAFVNRAKVLDFIQTSLGQPSVSHVTPAAESSRPLLAPSETTFIVTADPTLPPTLVTETATAVGTPSPEMAIVTAAAAAEADTSEEQLNATPVPNGDTYDGGNNGNNGNHYGQTPAPERTKESGGGGGNEAETDPAATGTGNGNGRGH